MNDCKLPLKLNNLVIHSLGRIDPNYDHRQGVFPINFIASRMLIPPREVKTSVINLIFTIKDSHLTKDDHDNVIEVKSSSRSGPIQPSFHVTCVTESATINSLGRNVTEAWHQLLKQLSPSPKAQPTSTPISAFEAFGLKNPQVQSLIENMQENLTDLYDRRLSMKEVLQECIKTSLPKNNPSHRFVSELFRALKASSLVSQKCSEVTTIPTNRNSSLKKADNLGSGDSSDQFDNEEDINDADRKGHEKQDEEKEVASSDDGTGSDVNDISCNEEAIDTDGDVDDKEQKEKLAASNKFEYPTQQSTTGKKSHRYNTRRDAINGISSADSGRKSYCSATADVVATDDDDFEPAHQVSKKITKKRRGSCTNNNSIPETKKKAKLEGNAKKKTTTKVTGVESAQSVGSRVKSTKNPIKCKKASQQNESKKTNVYNALDRPRTIRRAFQKMAKLLANQHKEALNEEREAQRTLVNARAKNAKKTQAHQRKLEKSLKLKAQERLREAKRTVERYIRRKKALDKRRRQEELRAQAKLKKSKKQEEKDDALRVKKPRKVDVLKLPPISSGVAVRWPSLPVAIRKSLLVEAYTLFGEIISSIEYLNAFSAVFQYPRIYTLDDMSLLLFASSQTCLNFAYEIHKPLLELALKEDDEAKVTSTYWLGRGLLDVYTFQAILEQYIRSHLLFVEEHPNILKELKENPYVHISITARVRILQFLIEQTLMAKPVRDMIEQTQDERVRYERTVLSTIHRMKDGPRLEVLDTDDAVAISTAISELNVAFSMRVISSIFSAQSGDGRLLYPVFYELPSEEELPVYYEVIDQPMDIQRLIRNLDDKKYKSLASFMQDVRLMWRNARTFNKPGSQIHRDAQALDRVTEDIFAQLRAELNLLTQTASSDFYYAVITEQTDGQPQISPSLSNVAPSAGLTRRSQGNIDDVTWDHLIKQYQLREILVNNDGKPRGRIEGVTRCVFKFACQERLGAEFVEMNRLMATENGDYLGTDRFFNKYYLVQSLNGVLVERFDCKDNAPAKSLQDILGNVDTTSQQTVMTVDNSDDEHFDGDDDEQDENMEQLDRKQNKVEVEAELNNVSSEKGTEEHTSRLQRAGHENTKPNDSVANLDKIVTNCGPLGSSGFNNISYGTQRLNGVESSNNQIDLKIKINQVDSPSNECVKQPTDDKLFELNCSNNDTGFTDPLCIDEAPVDSWPDHAVFSINPLPARWTVICTVEHLDALLNSLCEEVSEEANLRQALEYRRHTMKIFVDQKQPSSMLDSFLLQKQSSEDYDRFFFGGISRMLLQLAKRLHQRQFLFDNEEVETNFSLEPWIKKTLNAKTLEDLISQAKALYFQTNPAYMRHEWRRANKRWFNAISSLTQPSDLALHIATFAKCVSWKKRVVRNKQQDVPSLSVEHDVERENEASGDDDGSDVNSDDEHVKGIENDLDDPDFGIETKRRNRQQIRKSRGSFKHQQNKTHNIFVGDTSTSITPFGNTLDEQALTVNAESHRLPLVFASHHGFRWWPAKVLFYDNRTGIKRIQFFFTGKVAELPAEQCPPYDTKRIEVEKVLQSNESTVYLRMACIACAHYIKKIPPA